MPPGPSLAPLGAAPIIPVDPVGPAFDAAHKAVLAHRNLQFDFLPYVAAPPRAPPGWLKAVGQAFEAAAPVLRIMFWGGVALAVAFIVFLILREMGAITWRRRKRDRGGLDFEYRPDAATAAALLADADELAAQGRFAEAVHSLLLRSIDDMRTRRPRAVQPGLTSRDIAILPALPEPARPAFAAMAAAVERSLFGGRGVDRAEFDACRQSYEAFAFPKVWA